MYVLYMELYIYNVLYDFNVSELVVAITTYSY